MTERKNPFRLVGGTDANEEALPKTAKSRRRQSAVEVDDKPEDREPGYRDRATVKREIDEHIAARKAYQQGVSWIAAAEAENLPVANIEAAREDLRQLHAEMVEASRQLVIVMPTDLKALCDLTMYLENNFTSLPTEVDTGGMRGTMPKSEALAFNLLRTVRLSLRHVARYGKHGKDCDRLSRRPHLDD
jgi:hypothetical protein